MDSLTQFAFGAAVGEATLGRRVGNRALSWGAVCGTLPDLDVFIPMGGAVQDFTYHRSFSHSLFVLAALTPLIVWLILKRHPQTRELKWRWALLVYLVFASHVLLDSLTAYGTQILWPFITTPVAWSSLFIIDPLYTLPLLVGIIAALVMTRQDPRGHRISNIGLMLSTTYLGWSIGAKLYVDDTVKSSLARQNIAYERVFTTPTPFNTLLWRAVVMDGEGYYEGYYSVLDDDDHIEFEHYPSREDLLQPIEDAWPVQRLQWFSRGFYAVKRNGEDLIISDLRMGVEPNYVFSFKLAELNNPHPRLVSPRRVDTRHDYNKLNEFWRRIWSEPARSGSGKGLDVPAH